MSSESITPSSLLNLKNQASAADLRSQLERLKEKLEIEAAVPWKLVVEKIVERIPETLDVPLTDLCLNAWKKLEELREYADASKYPPDEENEVALLEHEIVSEQHPGVEVVMSGLGIKRKIMFDLVILLKLTGCSLVIRNGRIIKVLPGKCVAEAQLKFGDAVLAQARTGDIELGEMLDLDEGIELAPSPEGVIPRPADVGI